MPDVLFKFEEFELDSANFQLRRSGSRVHLQKIPLDLLLLLVKRSGQLVTRTDIVQAVWGSEVFLDVESALSTAIRKIRRALGDNATEPRYVETVPTKGYRFIADLQGQATAQEISAGEGSAVPSRPTIAVLPLEDLSDDPRDYFSDGMTEEILTHLGRLHRSLAVIARTSVMKYKGNSKSIHQIGRELGVSYVLEGSVRRDAGRVRIAVQLIETQGQTHLWAESYERALDDVFRLQDGLANEIARQISSTLKVAAPPAITSAFSVGRDAYEAYLKGRYFWNKRTAPGTIQSIDCFEEAIRREPCFAAAHAGLADAYVFQGLHGFRLPAEAYPKAEEAAVKALALNSCLADAYCSLASIQDLYNWNWTTAEPLFLRAIELNPSYPVARFFYAGCLSEIGRYEEAIRQIAIAQELDPLSATTLGFSGYIFYRAREYRRANEKIDQAVELEPDSPLVHWFRGLVREREGELEQAIQAFTEAVRLSMGQPLFVAALGHAFGEAQNKQEARRALDQLVQPSGARYVSPFEIAVIHIGLTDTNSAFEWLEQAYDQRVTRMRALRDPLFDGLRSDARFGNLIARVNLPLET